jgi:hypothetical protein
MKWVRRSQVALVGQEDGRYFPRKPGQLSSEGGPMMMDVPDLLRILRSSITREQGGILELLLHMEELPSISSRSLHLKV